MLWIFLLLISSLFQCHFAHTLHLFSHLSMNSARTLHQHQNNAIVFDDVASPLPNLLLAPNLPLAFKQTGFPSACNITLQLSPMYECIKHCVCVCVPYLLFRPFLASGLWPLLITGRGPGIPWSSLLKIHLLMLACTHSLSDTGHPTMFLWWLTAVNCLFWMRSLTELIYSFNSRL